MKKALIILLIIALAGGAFWWFYQEKPGQIAVTMDDFIPESSILVIEHQNLSTLINTASDTANFISGFSIVNRSLPAIQMLGTTTLIDAQVIVCLGADSTDIRVILKSNRKQIRDFKSGLPAAKDNVIEYQSGDFDARIEFAGSDLVILSLGSFTDDQSNLASSQFWKLKKIQFDKKNLHLIMKPEQVLSLMWEDWPESFQGIAKSLFQSHDWISLEQHTDQNHIWLNGVASGDVNSDVSKDNEILRFVPGNATFVYYSSATEEGLQTGMMYYPLNSAASDVYPDDLFVLAKGKLQADFDTVGENNGIRILKTKKENISEIIQSVNWETDEVSGLHMGDVYIFHPESERLDGLIKHYLADNRLIHQSQVEEIFGKLSDASATLIARPSKWNPIVQMQEEKRMMKSIDLISMQTFSDLDQKFFSISIVRSSQNKEKLIPFWVHDNDTSLKAGPWLFTNHQTGEPEFLVQDENDRLMLINAEGRLLWKRQLDGPIVEELKKVNTYSNKKFQILAATQSSVYLIDRNGKDLEGFPYKPEHDIAAAPTMINYSEDKVRIVIPTVENILDIDEKGKTVSGWNSQTLDKKAKLSPVFFSESDKDYILVLSSDNKLHFLDPTGKKRKKSMELAAGKNHSLLMGNRLSNSKIVFHDSIGNIHSCRLSGECDSENILPLGDHVLAKHFKEDGKEFHSVLDNDRYLTLDESFNVILDHTLPESCDQLELVEFNGAHYAVVSSSISNHSYLFIVDEGLCQNMPVTGIGNALLCDTDLSGSPELILRDNSKVDCYKIVLNAQ